MNELDYFKSIAKFGNGFKGLTKGKITDLETAKIL